MTQFHFGGGAADTLYGNQVVGSTDYMTLSGGTVTFWTAQTGGTQYTVTFNGSPTTSITVSSATGQIPSFLGPDGVTNMWADAGAGRVQMWAYDAIAVITDAAMDAVLANPSSASAQLLAATFASLPAATENAYFVSATGNDSNNGRGWGSAFATIGAALSAAGSSACHIRVGAGIFTITSADASGNGVTLNNPSTVLEGEGVDRTVININVSVGWGIVAQAARCQIRNMGVYVLTGKTVTNAIVGASTVGKTSGSAEGIVFDKLYAVANTGSTVNACYGVGNDTTGGSIDLAFTEFRACVATGNGVATHGYYLGNGTSGNILLSALSDCQANSCANGLTANGTAFTWLRGGMSGNTTNDFNYLGGIQDACVVEGARFENGKRFWNSNASVGAYSGVTLIGNLLGNYTPSDNILISHGSLAPLVMIGGDYGMTPGAADSSIIQMANGARTHSFVAIGVTLNNPAGWPGPQTWLRRTIIAAQTIDGTGHPIPNDAYQHVVDGGLARAEATKTGNYNLLIDDSIIVSNGTSLTNSLPDPTTVTTGVVYSVVNSNASACTVNSQGTSKTINGAASTTLAQWETGSWFSDGTQWIGLASITQSHLQITESQVTGLVADLAAKAPTASPTFTGTVTVPTTVNPTDAAQKQYVDAVAQGLSIKSSVKAATSSNTTLSGLGAVDGYTPSANDRILLTGQTTGSQNGIWLAQSGAWTRPTDFATGANAAGSFTFVEGGTTNNASGWVEAQTGTITIDTTAQVWTQFSGAGEITTDSTLTKSGNQLSRAAVSGDVTITAGSNTSVLAAVGTAATSGDAAHSLTITTDSKGRVTGVTVNSIQIAESQVTGLTSDLGNLIPKVPAANLATANGTYTVPGTGTVIMRITATGAGAGGSGGGSALTSGGTSTQVGGAAGGCGNTTVSIQSIAAGTVLTHTIGAGGTAGTGGAANGNAGTNGGIGGNTTVTGSGLTTVTALGGGPGNAGGANSTTTVGGGWAGTARSAGSANVVTTLGTVGCGGQATSTTGYAFNAPMAPYGQSGGMGGGPATASNGGLGGSAGAIGGLATTVGAGGSGTTAGGNGASAANNSGCGGGGGGGGAPGGAGGNGGVGGSGWVLYEVIG